MTDPTNPSKFSKLLEAANQAKPSSQPAPKRDLKSLYLNGQESTGTEGFAAPKTTPENPVTGIFKDETNQAPKIPMPGPGASMQDYRPQKPIEGLPQEQASYKFKGMPMNQENALAQIYKAQSPADLEGLEVSNDPIAMKGLQKRMDSFSKPAEKNPEQVNPFMSYLNIFSSRIANVPADLGEGWAIASAAIERGLGKLGVPGASKDLQATDIATYKGAETWRKWMDEVYPTNKPDRETFLGGVMDGLGQVVPLALSGGASTMPKVALEATKAGSSITPFLNTGKEIAKKFASKEGILAGSQIAAPSYKQAKESGATEDEALQYAIENFAVGSVIENLPIQSMFSRIAKLEPKSPVLAIVKEGLVGGSEEAVTEMWQTMYENWSANRIYEANQEIFEGIGEAGSIGGTVGFILNAATTALIGKRAKTSNPQEKQKLDEAIAELEQKQEQVQQNNQNFERNVKALEVSALLGDGIGTKSFGSTKPSNVERRKQAGKVVLATDKNGKTVEITGPPKAQEDGSLVYPAITAGGKFIKINENEVGEVSDVDLDTFNQVLEGKFQNLTETESEINGQIGAQAGSAIDQFRSEFQPFAVPTPMGPVVSLAQYNGQDVFVLQDQPNGNVVIQAPGQPREIVSASKLSGTQFMPFDQFVDQFGPIPESTPVPYDPANPVQAGEEVEIEGQSYVVTGVNYETNQVQLELQDGDNVDVIDLPLEAFQSLRKPLESLPNTQNTPQPQSEPKSGAARLREMFPTEEQKKQQEELRSQERSDGTLKPITEIDPNEPTTSTPESPAIPAQSASPEQAGTGQLAPENVPQEPGDQGVDGQVQVEDSPIKNGDHVEFGDKKGIIINVSEDGKTANVRIKGTGDSENIPISDLKKYSPESAMNESWRKEFERAKSENDLKALDTLYNKVKVALNGLAQGKGDATVKDFEMLKSEMENYAKELKANQPTTPTPQNEVRKAEPQPEAGQNAVQAEENQENQQGPQKGPEKLEPGGVKGKKKYPKKKTPEQIRKREILDREPTTATGYARQWLLNGGKLNSTQSAENREKGVGIGKGVRDETGMSGREMRSLIGIIDNKNGLSPEVAAERIHEKLKEESAARIEVQDLRNALIDIILSENRKDWLDNQDRDTQEAGFDGYEEWLKGQLTPEELADIEAQMQNEAYWENISDQVDDLAGEFDEFVNSEEYDQYIAEIYGQFTEGTANGEDQADAGNFEEAADQDGIPGEAGIGTDPGRDGQGPDRPDIGDPGKPQSPGGTGREGNPFHLLNPIGDFLNSLQAARESGLSKDQIQFIESKGNTLQSIRNKFPQLTDLHENEIFTALNGSADAGALAELIFNKVNSVDFDPSQPLNFTSTKNQDVPVTKGGEIDKQIKAIQARTKQITDLGKKRKLTDQEKAEIQAMTKEVNRLQQAYDQTQSKQEAAKPAEQGNLFGGKPKAADLLNKPQPKESKPEAKPKAADLVKPEPSEKADTVSKEELQDVGEKIEGARKDQIQKYFDKINLNGKILSVIFPKPDFQKLLDSGLSVKDVAGIKVAYEFAVADKKKGPEVMKFYASYAKSILANSINVEYKEAGYEFTEYGKSQIVLRSESYEAVSRELGKEYLSLDLTKVKIREMTDREKNAIKFSKNPVKDFLVSYYASPSQYFDTKEEAIQEFVNQVGKNTKKVEYKHKLGIYHGGNTPGYKIGIAKKGKPFINLQGGFKTAIEARQYLDANEADLQLALERILQEQKQTPDGKSKVRLKFTNETTRDRVGNDWRKGKNVSSQEFADTFGFRGVEFGNWVNLKERQTFVNSAYDSLMDLAQLMGIPPQAISLSGELAITFGSRGAGQASAHYEPGRKLINLTKTKGLGSLAHEWFHAIDNYFAGFGDNAKRMKASTFLEFKGGARKEIQQAFSDIRETLEQPKFKQRSVKLDNQRNKDYYSQAHERAARAFENYVLTRLQESGQVNDFLVNYVSPDDWAGEADMYPYPIGEESQKIKEAFDKLIDTLKVDESSPNKPLYMIVGEQGALNPQKVPIAIGTKAFKDWFGDSKVVDDDGNPMPVYHGTEDNFTVFEPKGNKWASKVGFWFSQDKSFAENYGENIVDAYLSIKKPKVVPFEQFDSWRMKNSNNEKFWSDKKAEWIKDGFDGLKIEGKPEVFAGVEIPANNFFVAFSPTQIKSATGNQGTFDPKNPDIRYSRASDLVKPDQQATQSKRVKQVQQEAQRITQTWKNGPAIEVYPNGKAIEEAFPEVQFRDMDRVPGLFYQGKVVLNASHPFHSTPGGTETIILHESIGHYGIGNVIEQLSAEQGKDANQQYGQLMKSVFDRYQDTELMAYVAKTYFGKDPSSLTESEQIEAGEEYIAHTAQTGVKDKWIDRVIAKIRQLLRDLGFKLQMADAELRAILGRASRFVVDGPGRVGINTNLARAMQTGIPENDYVQVINGFYSPIEKRILDFKQPKASATKWKEIVGKKDEAQWTGVYQYLDGLKPDQQVTKQELLDWMKDNRVQIEIISTYGNKDELIIEQKELEKQKKALIEEIRTKAENHKEWQKSLADYREKTENSTSFERSIADEDLMNAKEEFFGDLYQKQFKIENRLEEIQNELDDLEVDRTKYSNYQLEGDKTDYKEVLVTLPEIQRPNKKQQNRLDEATRKFEEFNKILDQKYGEGNWSNSKLTEEEFDTRYELNSERKKAENEILDLKTNFKSSHFDEPNILVHLRINTRTDAEGNKVLFLEEVQSDWGQEGKRKGFQNNTGKPWEAFNPSNPREVKGFETEDQAIEYAEKNGWDYAPSGNGFVSGEVPQAPFVTDTNSWVKLGLKVAMQEAVAQGADKIAWTTGTQQNERYDLSKQVETIQVTPLENGNYDLAIDMKGNTRSEKFQDQTLSQIEALIGKDMANKIANNEGELLPRASAKQKKTYTYSGENLQVGGTGMKAFYGDPATGDIGIIGRVMESLVGKGSVGILGIDQGQSKLDAFQYDGTQDVSMLLGVDMIQKGEWVITKDEEPVWIQGMYASKQDAIENFKIDAEDAEVFVQEGQGLQGQHFVTLTPEVLDTVEGGLPLFMRQGNQTDTPAFKAWFGDSKVVDENGKPLTVYHGTASDFDTFKPRSKAPDTLFEKDFENDVYFFSNSPETASQYAESTGMQGANVMPVKLSIQNPYVIDRGGKGYRPNMMSAWIKQAKDAGHDGLIVRNMRDFGQESGTQYAVFEPTQIKSATGNNGNFDGSNPDIRYTMTPEGAGIRTNDFVPSEKKTRIQNRLENEPNFLTNPRYLVDPAGVESVSVENQRRKGFLAKAKAYFAGKNPLSQEKRTRLRENFQDAMLPGRRLIERKAGDMIKDASNFYVQENLAADKIVFQIEQMEQQHIKPIKALTDQMQEKHQVTFDQIEDYLGALHNGERRDYLTKKNPDDAKKYKDNPKWPTGMTDEEAAQIKKDFEAKVPQADRDKLNELVKGLVEFSLDKRLESGLISQAYYDQLKSQYEFYIPLRGWADRIEYDPTKYSPMKEAKGRISKAASPLSYLYADAADAIAHGERNKVFQAMYNFVMEYPDKNEYMVKASYFRKSKKDDGTETWVEMDESEGKPDKEELKKGTVIRGFNPEIMKDIALAKHGDLTLPVFIKGQKVYILFGKQHEQLVKAIKKTAYSKIEGLAKISAGFTRFLSSAFTEYSPEFGFVNGARDMQMGNFSVMMDDGPEMAAAVMKKYPKSIKQLYGFFWDKNFEKTGNPYLKEFMESGAFTGFSQAKEVKDIYKMLSNQSLAKKWDETKVAKVISTHNKAIENAYRFAYFQAMREKGFSVQKAASKAKDVTVNFRRRGNMTSSVGAYYAFFNAGIQGTERSTRPFFNPETRKAASAVAGTLFALGFMQAAMYNLFGAIDEEDDELLYDKIPDFTRSMNIIIPFPNESGYVTVPMGYGLNIPYALGELMANVAAGKKKPTEAMMRALTIISESFSPLGGYEFESNNQRPSQKAVQFVSPTYSKPIVDLAINSNFAGFQIIPDQPWEKGVPNSQLASPSTSNLAVKASELINAATGGDDVEPGAVDLNPTALEYLAKQYGGGPLNFSTKVIRTWEVLTGGDNPLISDNARKVPFVSRFYQDANNTSSVLNKYFKNREEILVAVDRYEKYHKTDRPEKAEEYFQKNRSLIEMESFLKSYDKGLKSIRKAIEAAEIQGDEQEVQKLKNERDNLMSEFNAITKMSKGDRQVRASDLLN